MKEILVSIPVKERHKAYLENTVADIPGSGDVHFLYELYENITQKMVENADVIIGTVPAKYLKGAKHLELVQLSSAGAVEYTHPGVMPSGARLANATGAYGPAISEHMLGMTLMLMKKLNHYQDNMKTHDWKDEGPVKTIVDSVTLVVGMGDIGGQFARKMNALGSHVLGIRRNKVSKPDFLEGMYQMDALDDLLGRADIVACSLPGTKETDHLFRKERLSKMKRGAILLNVGRGSLIPTEDLCEALKSGRLGGAAVDVTETEPLPADSPLWDAPNLLVTPHVSGNYHAVQILESIVEIAAYNLRQIFSGGHIKNEVDFQTGYRKFCEPAGKQEEMK
ncbi:D-2-hydroxyacid dehydrogenase [Clostridium sp. C105KSO13]|uniref:D-2-hydroxyacid dehydrogenase n=1 Tax=Clostridium sp. C105KSO13 TaxID=1776045 RepID=UPI001A9A4581|nr:D-2-hydroxyacid dehydrogenase [Clostridium sp. C105KSO13]